MARRPRAEVAGDVAGVPRHARESIGESYNALARAFNFVSRLQNGLCTDPREFIPSDPPAPRRSGSTCAPWPSP